VLPGSAVEEDEAAEGVTLEALAGKKPVIDWEKPLMAGAPLGAAVPVPSSPLEEELELKVARAPSLEGILKVVFQESAPGASPENWNASLSPREMRNSHAPSVEEDKQEF
jgi:hypothetical protein